MSDQYIGEIRLFAGNFAPRGWAFCNGQLLSIQQNAALFSILGTYYGGNGVQTFALPNLQGRVPVGQGTGAGLSPVVIGEQAGSAAVTVLTSNLPSHTHTFKVNSDTNNTTGSVGGNYLDGKTASGEPVASTGLAAATLNPATINTTGSGVPVDIMPPFLGLSYIIALQGIFPSRN